MDLLDTEIIFGTFALPSRMMCQIGPLHECPPYGLLRAVTEDAGTLDALRFEVYIRPSHLHSTALACEMVCGEWPDDDSVIASVMTLHELWFPVLSAYFASLFNPQGKLAPHLDVDLSEILRSFSITSEELVQLSDIAIQWAVSSDYAPKAVTATINFPPEIAVEMNMVNFDLFAPYTVDPHEWTGQMDRFLAPA